MAKSKIERRNKIRKSIRKRISGTATKPRLAVFRSNNEFYAQLIDDVNSKTLLSVSSIKDADAKGTKTEKSIVVGKKLGEKAVAANITDVVFDRGGYLYHGRVKAFADAAREAGLKF